MPSYDLSWILPYVRKSLRGRGNLTYDNYMEGLWEVLHQAGINGVEKRTPYQSSAGTSFNFDAASRDLKLAAVEAFAYLEHNRFILRPPPTSVASLLSHSQIEITQGGQDWANGVEPLPEDYNGYMKQFDAKTDDVVLQYVSEALKTYLREAYFASAVMIGAASEKTIYLLADSMLPALKDPARQSTLQKRIDARKLEQLLKYVEQIVIEGHANRIIPIDVMGGTTRHLLSLFDSIRLQRNDAIHPMNFVVSADSVRFTLAAFPMAFERVEVLRKWCLNNPGSL